MNSSSIRKLIFVIILLVVTAGFSYRLGQKNFKQGSIQVQVKSQVVHTTPPANREVDFTLFWDVWSKLEKSYLDKKAIDPQKMVYGAISGMVAALGDPYTVFLPPKENQGFKNDLNGTFEGIGAQLGSKDDKIVVIAPLKGQPADIAGIKAGDWIIKVNDEDTFGWTVPQAVNKIRGPQGSEVKLTILHEGSQNQIEIKVTRDKINIKSVEFEVKTSQSEACKNQTCPAVGYLKLSRFGDQTNDEWNAGVTNVRARLTTAPKLKGLIFDLRNNSGGYFQSAIHVASEFLNKGVVVIQENSDATRETFSVKRVGNLLDVPLVVLINKGSASAAEIVAGALKDHGRGRLIGETTFGKGSVQTPEELPDGSGLHITTAHWIMPKGDWINGKGIKPDIEVKSGSDSADLQLERAIEELIN